VVYHDGVHRVFVNRCPHRHLPLDRGGRVLRTPDASRIICGNHGAKFDPLTGRCVAGPCTGKSLQLAADLMDDDVHAAPS
jgi:nitrite reductase/ring-hydroxylating ferredoxin subunit